MHYMILVYIDPATYEDVTQTESEAEMAEYLALSKTLRDKGRYVVAASLQSVDTATTVRVRDSKTLTTSGPFAPTREYLGGFYLVNVESLDQAIEIAAAIPDSKRGSVEIRPVVDSG